MRRFPNAHSNKFTSKQAPGPGKPQAKVFNCVVDDIALIIGTKKSTRDGFRKWVANGAIRLFVPLYTLEQLDFMKNATDRIGNEAREVLEWLDEVTTAHPENAMLQGVQETYNNWAEVEKHLLPETLLSAPGDSSDGLTETFEQTSISSATPSSPRSARSSTNSASVATSPGKTSKSLSSINSLQKPAPVPVSTSDEQAALPADPSTIQQRLQPLLNHLLWRIHEDPRADTDTRSYIFVANNQDARAAAGRFGVRVKTFEQVREVIKREERDLKNRMTLWRKENQAPAVQPVQPARPSTAKSNASTTDNTEQAKPEIEPEAEAEAEPDSDEEVIVMRPRGSPTTPASAQSQPVLDPNDFARVTGTPNAPKGPSGRGRGGLNGARGAMNGGRGGPMNGHRGSPKMNSPFTGSAQHTPTRPIDPDSYARPPPMGGSLRGGRRKLWTPS
ncbi:MAG: hypothetical protein M1820_006217 [Bogoriella megaspora]|nr:MAG: hypothetical protein M1820_006217 [Bogoriella megaspora]